MADPIVMTRQSLANSAADRFRATYSPHQVHGTREKQSALDALWPDPTPDAVDAIIGNTYWTTADCDGCGKSVEAAVQVGETAEPYERTRTACLCASCLRAALAALEEATR